MKRLLMSICVLSLLLGGCSSKQENNVNETQITLSDEKIEVNGKEIDQDPSQAIYCANDIVYYEANKDFTYGEGSEADEHEASEAASHQVVHITQPGTYRLSGKLSLGQIAVDLGEGASEDPNAIVTLVLDQVDITCKVAPAIIFYEVYECGNTDVETATKDVDTSKAGANVIIADDSENHVTGSYVAKIYKSVELNEAGTEVVDSKKLHKYDGAFYSKQSLNMNGGEKGNGILNIKAENEGLDSELHLTINGGNINIISGNDGINTNEDNVSVTTLNGGNLNIRCDGSTGEGDGIDSNGWLVINGGSLSAQACATSGDAGIDSDKGIYINGGKVVASGNMLDHIAGGEQTYAVFNFATSQNETQHYYLKGKNDVVVGEYQPTNDFTYLIVAGDELVEGEYTFYKGDVQLSASKKDTIMEKPQGEMPERPEDMPEPPQGEMPERPEGMPEPPQGEKPENMPEMPEGQQPPEGMPQGGHMQQMPQEELSPIFNITKGANYFSFVSEKQ